MDNSSILPNLNSTLSLSSRLQDIVNVFLIPSVAICLVPVKLVSIAVLIVIIKRKKKKKHKVGQYFYLLNNETCDLIQAVIACFSAVFRCGSYCSIGFSYTAKIFDVIFLIYVIPVLLQIQVFMEISFSLDRIKALKVTNIQVKKGMKFRYKLAISLVISLIVAAPNYLISSITPVGILVPSNQTLYVLSTTPIFDSFYWPIGLTVLNILRGIVPMLLLSIFNIILIKKFNNKKIRQHSNDNLPENRDKNAEVLSKIKEMDISKLVTAINATYLIGYLPTFMSPIFNLYFGRNSTISRYYIIVTSSLLVTCRYSYIFIFYKLSTSFKKTFLKTFMNK